MITLNNRSKQIFYYKMTINKKKKCSTFKYIEKNLTSFKKF